MHALTCTLLLTSLLCMCISGLQPLPMRKMTAQGGMENPYWSKEKGNFLTIISYNTVLRQTTCNPETYNIYKQHLQQHS